MVVPFRFLCGSCSGASSSGSGLRAGGPSLRSFRGEPGSGCLVPAACRVDPRAVGSSLCVHHAARPHGRAPRGALTRRRRAASRSADRRLEPPPRPCLACRDSPSRSVEATGPSMARPAFRRTPHVAACGRTPSPRRLVASSHVRVHTVRGWGARSLALRFVIRLLVLVRSVIRLRGSRARTSVTRKRRAVSASGL